MPITVSTPWGERKERKEMEAFAKLHGLQFSEQDAFGLSMLPFSVLQGGAGCKNVVYGTWKGIDAWAFTASRTTSDGSSEYHACAAAPIPANCPSVEIDSTGALSRAVRRLGLGEQPVPFESEEFNKAFTVSSADYAFAHQVVSPEMMPWLLGNGQGWHFGIAGTYTLVHRNRPRPGSVPAEQSLDTIVGFYGQIPDSIASSYPLNAPAPMTPERALDMAKAQAAGFTPVPPGAPVPPPQVGVPVAAAVVSSLPGGVPGRLTVVGVQDMGVDMGVGRLVTLQMQVTLGGGQPRTVTQAIVLSPQHGDRVKPGAMLAGRFDPSTFSLLGIDWDAS